MDSFEWNKVAGAVLFAVLVSFGLSIFSDIIFETEAPESPGYVIAVAEPANGTAAGSGAAERQPIAILLASADAGAGEASAKKCAACHTFGEGEANKVGPNLYGVLDRPIAGHEGFEYSPAMVAHAAAAGTWTYQNLDDFLHDPKGGVPGTKMAFAGLKSDAERGNVIAYLRSLAASPAPLPEAPAAAPVGEAPAPTSDGSATAAPAAPGAEAAADGGTGGPSMTPQQGSLGAIDSTTADQSGAVPQVAPIEQPAPEPPAGQAVAPGAEPSASTAPASPEQPAGAEAPAAPAPAASVPAAPALPAPAAQPPAAPSPASPPAPAAATPAQGADAAPSPPAAPAAAQLASPTPAAPPPDAAGSTAAPAEPQIAQAGAPAPPASAPGSGGAATGGAFATLVASADAAKGQTIAKRCVACHTVVKDGANKVGPHLWDVVNRPVASVPDYAYSEAMKAFASGGSKTWTYDELSAYLENPKAHVPGNKMAFPGLKKEDDRANVVAYLRSLSDSPAPAP